MPSAKKNTSEAHTFSRTNILQRYVDDDDDDGDDLPCEQKRLPVVLYCIPVDKRASSRGEQWKNKKKKRGVGEIQSFNDEMRRRSQAKVVVWNGGFWREVSSAEEHLVACVISYTRAAENDNAHDVNLGEKRRRMKKMRNEALANGKVEMGDPV